MKLPLFATLIIIILSLSIPLIHYFSFDRDSYNKSLKRYTKLTTLSSIAYSVSWFEPRVRRFESSINRANPQLPTQDRLIFVYGDGNVK